MILSKIFQDRFKELILIVLLFLLAVAIRSSAVVSYDVQSDERLWVSRSFDVVRNFRQGEVRVTSHLGHPGVPPALLMAASQWLAKKAGLLDSYGFTRLEVSRLATILASAMVIPLLFILLRQCTSVPVALLASLMLAFDPRHIGYSRLAHLDGSLASFCFASIVLFILGTRKSNIFYILGAGVFWGLAIATKPTAVLLIPVCWLVRITYDAFVKKRSLRIFCWSDLGVVGIGHLVFASLYTRLWFHNSDYRLRLGIESDLATSLFRWGKYLKRNEELLMATSLAVIIALIVSYYLKLKFKKPIFGIIRNSILTFGLFLVALVIRPPVIENIVRFWLWVFSLSGETHQSFTNNTKVFAPGYFSFLLKEVPDLTLILSVIALIGVIIGIFRKHSSEEQSRALYALSLSFLLGIFVWFFILGVSSKQTWRYAMPLVPMIYFIAGTGIYILLKVVDKLVKSKAASLVLVTALVFVQCFDVYSWEPLQQIYFNRVSGDLQAAFNRDDGYLFAGQTQALEFLVKETLNKGDEVVVSVVGDGRILDYARLRFKSKLPTLSSIYFGYYRPERSDYYLMFHSHDHLFTEIPWGFIKQTKPAFRFNYRDTPIISIYKLSNEIKTKFPLAFDFSSDSYRKTGSIEREGASLVSILNKETDPAEYAFFTQGIGLPLGLFELEFTAELLSTSVSSEELLLRLELGELCTKNFKVRDFQSNNSISLKCFVDVENRAAIRVYWYGTESLRLFAPTLKKLS